MTQQFILTLRCPDQPGIVLAVAHAVVASQGNILESAQFSDEVTGTFCLRMRFESASDEGSVKLTLGGRLESFNAVSGVRNVERRTRTLLMVSKFDHCLVDLLYRWRRDELPIDIPLVVSNHTDCRELVEGYGIPFVHIPVTPDTKSQAESQLRALVAQHDIDLVVLARYMQVLSDELCRELAGRAINIHHSFLPGFKGAKPYHQAYERGVKLIGATAHYVTADLDEGPIIEQDVVRVSHAMTADELVRMGRDVERVVLSRAVRLHAEDRVLMVGHRTVVFD